MAPKKVVIQVFKAESADPDYQHIVQITVFDGETKLNQARLPGGDFENAKGMAEGLKRFVYLGGDITKMMPE